MATKIILGLVMALAIILAGCGGKAAEQPASLQTPITANENPAVQQPVPQNDPVAELRDIEITPSGNEKCFLSPCDCTCYMVQNVPKDKKLSTCAINCRDIYGISGCDFTNFQCVTLKLDSE
ncbi:MAG: hypothetical protein KKE20_00055 [Nanoarchaeota archaeon]|nr:hypothetical protein [Nanoarchaeota archaeon]